MYVVTLAFQKVGSKAPLHLQPYLDWGELLILSQCRLHPVSAPMLRDSSETGSAAEHVSNIHPVGAKVDCVGCRGGGRSESISCRCLCSWTVWQLQSPLTPCSAHLWGQGLLLGAICQCFLLLPMGQLCTECSFFVLLFQTFAQLHPCGCLLFLLTDLNGGLDFWECFWVFGNLLSPNVTSCFSSESSNRFPFSIPSQYARPLTLVLSSASNSHFG